MRSPATTHTATTPRRGTSTSPNPLLFYAYGGSLLAQDELQCAEHPALGSIREALGDQALTEEDGVATPVLVAGAERRCNLDTAPNLDAGRPYGLYGNRFAAAPVEQVRAAVTPLRPPTRTNLVAMAAPTGSARHMRPTLETIAVTAYTGFAAAVHESARLWPGVPVEVRTGFWGCGAFGGNRVVMSSLQISSRRGSPAWHGCGSTPPTATPRWPPVRACSTTRLATPAT